MKLNTQYLPRKDTVFTTMFLDKKLCEEVLHIILGKKIELVDVVAEHKNSLEKAALNSVYFDVLTRTKNGEIITLDLQRRYDEDRVVSRTVYYACREIATQNVIDGAYENLKNVMVTFILTEAPYKHDFKIKKITLKDDETGEKYSELLKIYEINLRRIDETDNVGLQTIRDFFGITTQEDYDGFIKKYESEVAKMLIKNYDKSVNTEMINVIKGLEYTEKYVVRINDDDLARERARSLEEGIEKGKIEGIQEGIEKGIKKGIEKGIEKGKIEGIQEGIEKGIEKSINIFIETLKELKLKEDEIINKLVNKFKLTKEQAQEYLK